MTISPILTPGMMMALAPRKHRRPMRVSAFSERLKSCEKMIVPEAT